MVEIVEKLLSSLRPEDSSLKNVDSSRDCLIEFLDYLSTIEQKHLGKFIQKEDNYLVELVYRYENYLDIEREVFNFYRASLLLAIRSFRVLLNTELGDNATNSQREAIRSYIFDLKPFIEYFERKENSDFVFFTVVETTIPIPMRLGALARDCSGDLFKTLSLTRRLHLI